MPYSHSSSVWCSDNVSSIGDYKIVGWSKREKTFCHFFSIKLKYLFLFKFTHTNDFHLTFEQKFRLISAFELFWALVSLIFSSLIV